MTVMFIIYYVNLMKQPCFVAISCFKQLQKAERSGVPRATIIDNL